MSQLYKCGIAKKKGSLKLLQGGYGAILFVIVTALSLFQFLSLSATAYIELKKHIGIFQSKKQSELNAKSCIYESLYMLSHNPELLVTIPKEVVVSGGNSDSGMKNLNIDCTIDSISGGSYSGSRIILPLVKTILTSSKVNDEATRLQVLVHIDNQGITITSLREIPF